MCVELEVDAEKRKKGDEGTRKTKRKPSDGFCFLAFCLLAFCAPPPSRSHIHRFLGRRRHTACNAIDSTSVFYLSRSRSPPSVFFPPRFPTLSPFVCFWISFRNRISFFLVPIARGLGVVVVLVVVLIVYVRFFTECFLAFPTYKRERGPPVRGVSAPLSLSLFPPFPSPLLPCVVLRDAQSRGPHAHTSNKNTKIGDTEEWEWGGWKEAVYPDTPNNSKAGRLALHTSSSLSLPLPRTNGGGWRLLKTCEKIVPVPG